MSYQKTDEANVRVVFPQLADREREMVQRATRRAMARIHQEQAIRLEIPRRTLSRRPVWAASTIIATSFVMAISLLAFNGQLTFRDDAGGVSGQSQADVTVLESLVVSSFALGNSDRAYESDSVEFATLKQAMAQVESRGSILVRGGIIRGPIRISKPVTILARNGQ